MQIVHAKTLLETYHRSLKFSSVYPLPMGSLPHISPVADDQTSYCGYYTAIRSYPITIFGPQEMTYFKLASARERNRILHQLLEQKICVLIFTENQELPEETLSRLVKKRIPILATPFKGSFVIDRLNRDLNRLFASKVTIPGVFMEVLGLGVMLTGKSGIGKSELALGLIHSGHRLVADDAVIFSRVGPNLLVGTCPPSLQDFLEVRGLGVINIRAIFGDHAIKENKRLQLMIHVVEMDPQSIQKVDRLHGIYSEREILEIRIPEVTIPVAAGRNLSVLIEAAVRNQILKQTGYDAPSEFIRKQQSFLEKEPV